MSSSAKAGHYSSAFGSTTENTEKSPLFGNQKHRTSLKQTSVLLRQNLRTFTQRSPMFSFSEACTYFPALFRQKQMHTAYVPYSDCVLCACFAQKHVNGHSLMECHVALRASSTLLTPCSRCTRRTSMPNLSWRWVARCSAQYTERCCPPVQPKENIKSVKPRSM